MARGARGGGIGPSRARCAHTRAVEASFANTGKGPLWHVDADLLAVVWKAIRRITLVLIFQRQGQIVAVVAKLQVLAPGFVEFHTRLGQ